MLQKRSAPLNFAMGVDTKSDPKQVQFGKFLSLVNSVFTTAGRLTKRNGFQTLATANYSPTYLTTFNGNLTAIGSELEAYSSANQSWTSKGNLVPISLSVLPTARSAIDQIQCDSVIATNGLICTVYTENNDGTSAYKYVIADSATGQVIINPTVIPVGSGTVTGSPRVFFLGNYFIIVFTNVISAASHLQYIAISASSPTIATANADIVASYVSATTLSWDGVVVGRQLFIAYNATSGGQQVEITYLDTNLDVATPIAFASSVATIMSVCADVSGASPVIYASFWDASGSTGYTVAVNATLQKLMTATEWLASGTIDNVTSAAQGGIVTIIYENDNTYSYGSPEQASNYLSQVGVALPATVTTGMVGSPGNIVRSVGLASKAFLQGSTIYFLASFQSSLQSTYFLIDINGNVSSRFAYGNGGGYLSLGLPQVQIIGSAAYVSYLYKDLIETQSTPIGSQGAPVVSPVYSQTGVNLAKLNFTSANVSTSEIGSNLNLSGGMLWAYDGQGVYEQGFHLFPDNIVCAWSDSGGSIHAQPDGSTNTDAYYYQVTYEWTDLQGNIIRSAPSIPVAVTTMGSGTDGSITVNVPYLRLSYKADVKIQIYRWSVENEIYYQVTSITAPTLNDPTSDSLAYVDTLADASIVGNNIIYTNGGVLENIAGPASIATTLFDNRLWLIDAEDQNLLWFSKQVIESVPVEMSDLLTMYVAPNTSSQGPTGPMTAIFPMDDKIIIFKRNAILYVNGSGPDNTGANSQYSQPIFITANVGCANQNSIVFTPNGLMFSSDKGIWLLGRDLTTSYIGADVEGFNQYTVNSALSIPGTTQVRFTLSNGQWLMYDYYYNQWGTFSGNPAVSATLFQDLHTVISSSGVVSQESPGLYSDNGEPVLMSLVTSWLNFAGLQGYQRAYFFYLLGQYITPHKLQVGIAYDYNPTFITAPLISPTNFSAAYGGISPYGQGGYGAPPQGQGEYGVTDLEQWRVFLQKQRCQAFQISVQEFYDASFGVPAGAGLTLSGLNFIYGYKSSFRPIAAGNSVG